MADKAFHAVQPSNPNHIKLKPAENVSNAMTLALNQSSDWLRIRNG